MPLPRSVVLPLSAAMVVSLAGSPAEAAPSRAERDGCNMSYVAKARWDLARGGTKRGDVGEIIIEVRESPSKKGDWRACAITMLGEDHRGERKLQTSVKIGSYDKNDPGDIRWHYTDSGKMTRYAGGVALTPGKSRCPIIFGSIVLKKKSFTRTVRLPRRCN